MISIDVKEEREIEEFDFSISSISELDELLLKYYKPLLKSQYVVRIELKEMTDIKFLINNSAKYNVYDVHLMVSEVQFKRLQLSMPNQIKRKKMSFYEYLQEGIYKRHLLMKKNIVRLLYSSVDKSYENIDDVLDVLHSKFGEYIYITEKDLSETIVVNSIVYPRTVLIQYINMDRYRSNSLRRCLADMSQDIVLGSFIKNVKLLHKQKCEYLRTGLGSNFIKRLNTYNLNLMYYHLVSSRTRNLNDICIILYLYEKGVNSHDLLHGVSY